MPGGPVGAGLRLLLVAAVLVAAACVPEDRGPAAEVSDLGVAREFVPPTWPEEGPASRDTLIEGLLYDLTAVEETYDQYVPASSEARCMAEQIVEDDPGADRLNELGYRPDAIGGRLTQLQWKATERDRLAEVFAGCVNLEDAFAQVLVGDFRFDTKSALCFARGLAKAGVLADWARAWAYRREMNLLADDNRIALAMVRQGEVCLGRTEFILPERDQTAIRPQNPNAPVTAPPASPGG